VDRVCGYGGEELVFLFLRVGAFGVALFWFFVWNGGEGADEGVHFAFLLRSLALRCGEVEE
jgi:hypothetical protein